MGFFSWNCPKCGHSIMSPYTDSKADLNECRLISEDGDIIISGPYDGYGRIESTNGVFEIDWHKDVMLYHRHCWKKGMTPEVSDRAEGQGFFYDDGDPEGDYRI